MARVVMIPTGLAEWHGLVGAFARLFPGHTFEVLPSAREMEAAPDRYPLDGFTSTRLTDAHEKRPPESALELIARAAQTALGDTRARVAPADLVIVLDDLEPANADQPDRVLRVFHAAARAHLAGLTVDRIRQTTADALRERVSFHLAAPMIEAWFFADPAGLDRAMGAARHTSRTNRFIPGSDPEDFSVADPAYASATEADCPAWTSRGRKKGDRPRWLSPSLDRTRHPKAYLQWLCHCPGDRSCTGYQERVQGAAALRTLDWSSVWGMGRAQMPFLFALIADIAEVTGTAPAPGAWPGARAPLTDPFVVRAGALLRNV
jgi:hypothetical protein